MYGIEINEYAHELAQITVWIGYIQWLRDNGFGRPSEPILRSLNTIQRMDAILAFDGQGNAYEPVWPEADVIIGNPPFLGIRKMREELDNEYVDSLRDLYAQYLPPSVDLVCYWFEKTRALIESNRIQRAGLIATNSIRGGSNRTVLERISHTSNIFMAWDDRSWILEGAAVRVSIVGFSKYKFENNFLNGQLVAIINSDLTTELNLTTAKQLRENKGISFQGTAQVGPFEIDEKTAKYMLNSGGNPNNRPNSDIVKPSINGIDITRRSRNIWTLDFGTNMNMEDASEYELPFEHVHKYVKPIREKVRRKNHREKWWLFAESRPGMRKAFSSLKRYIATPWVSKHRVFIWVPTTVVPSLVIVFARDDDYFFGVLHSKFHELWSLRMGTSLEDRPRYTATTTFETFPFPWAPGQEPTDDPRIESIAKTASELVQKRETWLNPQDATKEELKKRTLTNLYNTPPTWLANAHKKLDDAVATAYGWPNTLTDDEILARLLQLNQERAAGQ